MMLDNAIEIKIPAPDSQYRLVPCKCGSDNVAYVMGVDERWRVHCFDCGCDGASATVRHEAQVKWNGGCRDMKHGKNPTREQRKLMQKWKLDHRVWLVVKDTPSEMLLVHRYPDKTTKVIPKGGGDDGRM